MKFAVITFPGSNSDHDSYSAVKTLGEEVEYVWHQETDLTQVGTGVEAMRNLLAERTDFTAVFAFSDRAAIEAIDVIQGHGKRVPQDIAV